MMKLNDLKPNDVIRLTIYDCEDGVATVKAVEPGKIYYQWGVRTFCYDCQYDPNPDGLKELTEKDMETIVCTLELIERPNDEVKHWFLTENMVNKLKESYECNKADLNKVDAFIRENGCTNEGLSDVTESFEQGWNNALQFVFSVLQIDCLQKAENSEIAEEETDTIDEEINPDDYTIEYCPFCDSEQVIFSKGVTACPECGASLAPCSMCEECDYDTCPYGCTGGAEDELKKSQTRLSQKRRRKEYISCYKLNAPDG